MFFSPKWNPDGLHCYVNGGSRGLGLSLAVLLVKKGAHVSIVARDQARLDKALSEMEAVRLNPSQKLNAYSYSLATAKDSAAALHAVCEPYGGLAPDAIFACAGTAKPMFFVEMTEEDMSQGMINGYWLQAWTAFAASKLMASQKRKGKIVLVSSTMGYITYIGWAGYSPGKQAIRGLGDTLHSELMLYGIDVHTFFPPTLLGSSYEEELKTMPAISRKIEESEEGVTPDAAALALYKGVANGEVHITAGDFITNLFRAGTRGATPRSNWILDGFLDFIGFIATPVWRASVDRMVLGHRAEHEKYLAEKGFFTSS